MKRLIHVLMAAILLCGAPTVPAFAQTQSQVVSACGTNNQTPPTGTFSWDTMTADGKKCVSATISFTPSGTQDVNLKQVGAATVLTGAGATGTGSQRVTAAQDTTTIAGSAPGTAGTPSANVVSTQDVTGSAANNSANFVSGATAAMTGTTSTLILAIPGANLHNYLTQLTCGNSHATVGTFVNVQDGSGGTTIYTIPAAAVYGGAALSFPTPLRQPTANTALYVVDATTGANVICSAAGYKGS